MKRLLFAIAFLTGLTRGLAPAAEPKVQASLTPDGDGQKIRVEIDGKLFTELRWRGLAKPVLYPVYGPGDVPLLRRWPLEEAGPDEEKDHPHHQGIWFTHGAVNGVDFWMEKKGVSGVIAPPESMRTTTTDNTARVELKQLWQKPDGATVCAGDTLLVFGVDGENGDRFIDYTVTLTASEGDVLLGDTKEGTMAIRTRPELNLKGKVAKGQAVNSEGVSGADVWGKRARWVDYWAPLGADGKTLGLACFDHPSNLRHPTLWHARDYGLIAANPFAEHEMEKKPKGAGDYTIRKGESLTFRYRWLFHSGDATEAKIDERWKAWAAKPVER